MIKAAVVKQFTTPGFYGEKRYREVVLARFLHSIAYNPVNHRIFQREADAVVRVVRCRRHSLSGMHVLRVNGLKNYL